MHDLQNTVHMKIGTRKRLTFIFTYGGQGKDVAAVMDLMAKGAIKPEVSEGKFMDFPKVLKDLCDNKVEGRIALMHEH
jgi:propanol-preferring alcohol dehydrogenase